MFLAYFNKEMQTIVEIDSTSDWQAVLVIFEN